MAMDYGWALGLIVKLRYKWKSRHCSIVFKIRLSISLLRTSYFI